MGNNWANKAMNKEQARQLIKDTFEAPFDKEKFVVFIRELLNKTEESTFTYRGNFIPDAFEQYIGTLERIGKYIDGENEIDLLIVKLKKETSLERARTMQRNFVAWYLKGSRGGKLKDAALVAFVSPKGEDWRFSLVKMDYRFEETSLGIVKVKEKFTPARRWSFLVGKNEKSHTAQSQLVKMLDDDENNPTLAQLEQAFNIETVTKEFFEKYRNLFVRTVDELDKIVENYANVRKDFDSKNINTIDFAKKLLSQIVFLYFLQKKGWFGVERDADWGTGPKDFLRQLFKKKYGDYGNFFNVILESLFYEALARERDDYFYSRFNCKIPFLNGGLFEPIGGYDWVHTDIELPDELFSNKRKTPEDDEGDGILDIFDRFNFTVKEDEPLEKEVAIDPELLGKLYEKFNAIRHDNFYEYRKSLLSGKKTLEKKFNKKFGVYYTPREIVHYMCQQSLINYLHTALNQELMKQPARAPRQIKLIGPQEPEQLKFQTKKEIISKKEIEKLIKYGEQFAENEAVVVEKGKETKTYKYKLPESIRENAKIIDEKLKNIRVCDPAVGSGAFPVGMMAEIVKTRNVLSPFIREQDRTIYNFKRACIENSLYGVDIDPGAVEIAKLRLWLSLVVDEEDFKHIKPLPNLDYKIVCGNSLLGVEKNLFNNELFLELEKLKPLYFSETNPDKKRELKNQIEKLISKITNGHKEFDFEVYFSEVFHQKNGFDVVIGNPPYGFRNVLTAKEKEYFRKKENIKFKSGDSAELFCKKCFSSLVRVDGFLTFIIPKKSVYGDAWIGLRREYWSKYNLIFLLDSSKAFENVLLEQNSFGLSKKLENGKVKLAYLNKNNQIINFTETEKHKIIMNNGTVQIYKELYRGILKKIESSKTAEILVEGDLGLAIGTSFFSTKPTKYKLLKGIDIDRWRIKKHRYLKNEKKLKRQKLNKFIRPKTICQRLIAHIKNPQPHIKITACYDEKGTIITNTLTAFKIDKRISEKFWLAYLNSTFVNWYAYNFIYSRAIRTMDFYNFYIKQIPIPKVIVEKTDQQKPFVKWVDKILEVTKCNDYLENPQKQARVKEYEHQIDQMVYQFYDLTTEEIKIVEGFNKEL